MKNEDNTWKEQTEGAWEAMSQIIIQQENKRQLDTIRARVMERSIWKQGRGIARGMRKDVRSGRNRVAEVGFEYFCLDYVSKNGMSVMECNSEGDTETRPLIYRDTLRQGQVE